ncbi:hypothetical protein [Zavarzinella formosa]|uniref:hypothetical protein n=1 Tax=Zavarzinella formosa TaxID=360055 RepID=UPI0002DC15F1|nr:hypothetical protein [Zavarzinella formosa]
MDVIAEQRLDLLYPDGELVPVHIRIGRPQPHPDGKGDWGCLAEATGLRIWDGPQEFFGEGSLQALMLTARFLHSMLLAEIERGAAMPVWPDGSEMGLNTIFGFPHRTAGSQ